MKKTFTYRQVFQIIFIIFQKNTTYSSVVRFDTVSVIIIVLPLLIW